MSSSSSQPIISIQNLGKKYCLRHQRQSHNYVALRDVIADTAKSMAQRFWSILRPYRSNRNSNAPGTKEDFWALKDLSFDIHEGESVGIIGPNGAGKSTLLKILSRITEPTTGRVTLRGRVASLLEVGTGFHPELTGRENIFLNGAILGMARAETRRKFDDIVAFAEVEKFLDTPVKHYSSGMYVRLAFAVAAHLDPEILVVDEVLAVGDAKFQKKCLGKMDDVAKNGRTVLFVSHNMTLIESLCPQSILLIGGKLAEKGPSRAISKIYLEHCFLNRPNGRISERKDRKGNGAIKLMDIRLCDLEGNPVNSVAAGSACRLNFQYHSNSTPHEIAIAFTIRDERAQYLIRPSSAEAGMIGPICEPEGILSCIIPRMPLIPGDYRITVEIRSGGDIADYIEGAFVLSVVGGDYFGTGRMSSHSPVLLDHKWEARNP